MIIRKSKLNLWNELKDLKKENARLAKRSKDFDQMKENVASQKMAISALLNKNDQLRNDLLMAHQAKNAIIDQKKSFFFRFIMPAKFISSLFRNTPKIIPTDSFVKSVMAQVDHPKK